MISQNSILNRHSLVLAICTVLSFALTVGCGPNKTRARGKINANLNATGKPAENQSGNGSTTDDGKKGDGKDANADDKNPAGNSNDPLEETEESKKLAAEIESIKTERLSLEKDLVTVTSSELPKGKYTLQSMQTSVLASELINNKLAELAVLVSADVQLSEVNGTSKFEFKNIADSGVKGFVDSLLQTTLKLEVPVGFAVEKDGSKAKQVLKADQSVILSAAITKTALSLETKSAKEKTPADVDSVLTLLDKAEEPPQNKTVVLKSESLKDAASATVVIMKVDDSHFRIVLNYDERMAGDDEKATLNQSRSVILTYSVEIESEPTPTIQPKSAEAPAADPKTQESGNAKDVKETNKVTINNNGKQQTMTCLGSITTDPDGTLRCHRR